MALTDRCPVCGEPFVEVSYRLTRAARGRTLKPVPLSEALADGRVECAQGHRWRLTRYATFTGGQGFELGRRLPRRRVTPARKRRD